MGKDGWQGRLNIENIFFWTEEVIFCRKRYALKEIPLTMYEVEEDVSSVV